MQDTILRNLRKIVTPQFITETARKIKFTRRSTSQIKAVDFIHMMIMQVGHGQILNYSNLNACLSKICPYVHISNQALAEYFYRKSSVDLIKTIYEKIFVFQKEMLLNKACKGFDQKVLNIFNRIFLQDSTFCVLNKQLEEKYKGSGGSASGSSLKIDLIHELKSCAIVRLTISAGNVPDTSLSGLIIEDLQENDLIIRDLGYFKISEFRNIWNKGSYFLSRFRHQTNIYIDEERKKKINLGRYLAKIFTKFLTNVIDIPIYVNEEERKLRLIAYKVPQEIANERRRKAKQTANSKGRTASEERLNMCDYIILITNIPEEKLDAKLLGTIYRIRWAIELIFKTWKSQLKLQVSLKGYKATRIECFAYAILIICLLMTLIQGWLKRILDPMNKEISLHKLSEWLINREGYYELLQGNINKLEKNLIRDLRKIKKQERKRKTTQERIVNEEAYGDKYVVNF